MDHFCISVNLSLPFPDMQISTKPISEFTLEFFDIMFTFACPRIDMILIFFASSCV